MAKVTSHSSIDVLDDLTIVVADRSVRVSPSEALLFGEVLVRKAFRRALIEEAAGSGALEPLHNR